MTSDPSDQSAHAGRLVFVCHANHCRSPMMELLLRAALHREARAGGAPLLVSSAGTHARPGLAAHPYAVQVLAEHDVDATGWRAARLSAADVQQADLILTAAADQRREITAMSGGAADRTFTFLDFSAWLQAAPGDTAGTTVPDLLARAAAGRARLAGRDHERDLPDPMGRSLRHFRLCRRRIEAALTPFLE